MADIMALTFDENRTVAVAVAEITAMKKALDKTKADYDAMTKRLKELMVAEGYKKIETDTVQIIYKEPTTRESFDVKTFRKDLPNVYDDYAIIAPVSDSITIKLK